MLPWWEAKTKGIYIYGISPFYQRAFACFSGEIVRMVRNGAQNALVLVPIGLFGYGLIKWAEHDNHQRKRKVVPKEWLEEQD
jgi:hypothetical protein